MDCWRDLDRVRGLEMSSSNLCNVDRADPLARHKPSGFKGKTDESESVQVVCPVVSHITYRVLAINEERENVSAVTVQNSHNSIRACTKGLSVCE